MSEIISQVKSAYDIYNGTGSYMLIFAVALLLLIMFDSNDNIHKIVKYVIIFALIYICPISAKIIMEYCIGTDVYWRMFWILPSTLILAYATTCAVMQMKKKGKQIVCFGFMMGILMLSGSKILSETNFTLSMNNTKLDDSIIQVCETIEMDAKENGIQEIGAIFPNELVCYIRQYDANIKMPYGRDTLRGNVANIYYDILNAESIDWSALAQNAQNDNYQYLVYAADNRVVEEQLHEINYVTVTSVAGYNVYRLENVN